MNETLLKLADLYLQAREMKSELEARVKAASQEADSIEKEMIQLMTDNEIDSFKKNGILFSVVTREFQSANPERKEELYAQMKAKGYKNGTC